MTIEQIIEWGQQQELKNGTAVDWQGHFSRDDTERLRKQLRELWCSGIKLVSGSWRRGYEMKLPEHGAAIGVTNGYQRHFCIYYRPLNDRR